MTDLRGWAKQFEGYVLGFQDLEILGEAAWAIKFRRPGGGSINSVNFVCRRGLLSVVGDLGCANYQWAPPISIEFFERIDLGYFHSKCVASDKGSLPYDWSEEVARKNLNQQLEDQGIEGTIESLDIQGLESKFDWNQWLGSDDGFRVFGEGYFELGEIGKVIPCRTKLHWAIIQLCAQAKRGGRNTIQVSLNFRGVEIVESAELPPDGLQIRKTEGVRVIEEVDVTSIDLTPDGMQIQGTVKKESERLE